MRITQTQQVGVVLLEPFQMAWFGRQVAIAPGQVAIDGVPLDALADDVDGFETHALEFVDALFAEDRPELLDIVADTADQLAAVATAGPPADTPGFEEDDRQPSLGEFDGGIQSGKAAADDADVGAGLTGERGEAQRTVGAGGVVGGA